MSRDLYTKIIVVIGVLVFSLLVFLSGSDKITIGLVVSRALTTSAIMVGFDYAITRWLWKLWIINSLIVQVPNLQGTWVGTFKSSWIDPETNLGIPDIPVKVFIRQTMTTISVEVQTDKMTSTSYLAGVRKEPDTGNYELVYTYTSKSSTESRAINPWHDGSTKLQLFNGGGMKLKGEYWTARKTTGSIELQRESMEIKRY